MPRTLAPALLLLAACAKPAPAPPVTPALPPVPESPRGEVTDTYFGTEVADPYRWLEEPDSEATRAWIDAQNAYTRAWLDAWPHRERVRARLTEVWSFERYGLPVTRGGRTFFTHNDGLRDQSSLYVVDQPGGERRLLLDPNTLAADGTMSLVGFVVSRDGAKVAWGVSDGGSDWSTWRVRDTATGADLEDEVRWVKFSRPAWSPDGSGFYYGRYPANETNPLEAKNTDYKLYYHKLGAKQADDTLVYERPDAPEWGFAPTVTDDGSTLVIYAWHGTEEKNRVFLRDLREPEAPVRPLLTDFDASYEFLGNTGSKFVFKSNLDAPRGRILEIDTTAPERSNWRSLVPEHPEETLQAASWVGGRLVLSYLRDARSVVRLHQPDGSLVSELPLPGLGTVTGFEGGQDDAQTYFNFASFTAPPSVHRLDSHAGTATPFAEPKVAFQASDFETKQIFYTSKDGTRVPMFIVHRVGLDLDGARPTLLYGYGGFNQSITPTFRPQLIPWLEAGGVYAVANLRGGGEYGEAWHEAGTKLHKQNVFDDFIAAAEHLIEHRYTRPGRLAIDGRSNGGLLVAATLLQRPDLFGAATPQVGVLDMLRYHRFTIGWAWASDYGTSDDSEEMFKYLLAYSPVHNARPGVAYPPTMITTADRDDRVVPAHSFKFAAALQHAQAGGAPVLIRIETRAGHGAGTPTSKLIDQATDYWSFLGRALNTSLE